MSAAHVMSEPGAQFWNTVMSTYSKHRQSDGLPRAIAYASVASFRSIPGALRSSFNMARQYHGLFGGEVNLPAAYAGSAIYLGSWALGGYATYAGIRDLFRRRWLRGALSLGVGVANLYAMGRATMFSRSTLEDAGFPGNPFRRRTNAFSEDEED